MPLREQVAKALFNKGVALRQAGKADDAILVYDDVVARFGASEELPLREQVAKALFNKGVPLGEAGKADEELRVYDDVVARFGASEELPLREQVAKALFNKGVALGQAGKADEELRVYDDVVARFGASEELPLREQVAKALFNKGVTLGQAGKADEELRVYDDVVARFGASEELPLREQVAKALFNKGVTLGQAGKADDAILVCDEVHTRFGASEELPLREQVAKALLYKVNILLDLGRVEDSIALFERVKTRYLDWGLSGSALAPLAEYLQSRFASRAEGGEGTGGSPLAAIKTTAKTLSSGLMGYLTEVLKLIDQDKQKEYFGKITKAKERTDRFIHDESLFSGDLSFLLILREWNSYTPTIPGEEEADRGGGYFIRHGGEGIVIDPGYDFIENFYRAGGRLADINHVIVTHAHDDHTAELEALLMLLHRRWTTKEIQVKTRVSLYLSEGVHRKFSGLLDLKDPKYHRILTLCPVDEGCEQRINLSGKAALTVLPAYHDDVITRDGTVGLAFEFSGEKETTKIVFTGDSGLYPVKLDEKGEPRLYDGKEETPMLDVSEGKALYNRYPDAFKKPDLLVAHIGSIKENEFRPQDSVWSSRDDEGRWYYVNHLGLLGTLTMLHQLNPVAAIVSEFGSELRGFHFDLVDKLKQALHNRQKSENPGGQISFVVPGDLTIAYDIDNQAFLSHDVCEFVTPGDLDCKQATDYCRHWNTYTHRYNVKPTDGVRTYLFKKTTKPGNDNVVYNQNAEDYFRKFFNNNLPYHKKRP